jgi:signal peptidase complex subunit 1
MDEMLEQVRDAVEGQIVRFDNHQCFSNKQLIHIPQDFEGQRLAQLINYAFLSTFGVFSFLTGFFTANVYNALWVGLAGAVITMLAVVPPWPFYNKNPVQWLPSRRVGGVWVDVDEKKGS